MYGKTQSEETKDRIRKKLIGYKQSEETKFKQSQMRHGEKYWNWQGGITKEPYCLIWTKDLREYILQRDGYKCLNPDCLNNSHTLCVHHINYIKKDCESVNLITLCNSCNVRANYNIKMWQQIYERLIVKLYFDAGMQ